MKKSPAAFRLARLGGLVLLFVAALRPSSHAAPPPDPIPGFITARDGLLYDGDRPFHWVSVNMPDALQIISHYAFDGDYEATRFRLPDDYELRDCVETVRQLGGGVMRAFVITVRPHDDPNFMFNVATNPVRGNEAALRVIDRMLQLCHEKGVRVIIPLVAYHSAIRGDWSTYGDNFWNVGSATNLKFKNMVAQLLERKNSDTGVRYRDDPAILGWQTGNELEISNWPERRAWLHDFASFLHRAAPRQLVIDGRHDPDDVYQKYEEFASDPNIAAMSYHTYQNLPGKDVVETLRLVRDDLHRRKVLLVTEIAMWTPPATLRALLDEVLAGAASGGNFWALRFHNRDGGFYKHSDRESQFEDLNWPGFPTVQSYLPEIGTERQLLEILADYGWKSRGLARPAPSIPTAPELLVPPDPGHLSWRGSTGAETYALERATSPAGPWERVASDLTDGLVVYGSLWCDRTAKPGMRYWYRAFAANAAGRSPASPVVGPVSSQVDWLVDELFDLTLADPASSNLRIEKSYAHTTFLEDIALVVRAKPAEAARLVYQVPGTVDSLTLTAYNAAMPPQVFAQDENGQTRPVAVQAVRYDGGKRQRLVARGIGGRTIEIVLPAEAAPELAVGRVEISYAPAAGAR